MDNYFKSRFYWLVTFSIFGFMLGGCSYMPNTEGVDQARAAYSEAAQNTQIAQNAPVALHEAKIALEQAEQAVKDNADQEDINNLAYVAKRKVEIAQAVAQKNMAQKDMDRLAQERTQLNIDLRQAQADRAEKQAQQARQETEQLRQELSSLQGQLKETSRGTVLTLSDVLFGYNKAVLNPNAVRDLETLTEYLQNHPKRELLIEGYTDDTGSPTYNRGLAERRADVVAKYLTQHGVDPDRLAIRGYGEQYPVATNSTPSGRQQNRRVEIVLLQEGEKASVAARRGRGEERADFAQLDTNRDGYINKNEAANNSELSNNFSSADSNRDGKISRSEFSVFELKEQQSR